MPRVPAHFELKYHDLKMRRVQVSKLVDLSPLMRRITFGGVDMQGFVTLAPEDHVKLFFPTEETGELHLPQLGPRGPVFADGKKGHGRDYTPYSHNVTSAEVEIDFLLHDQGVAARWAKNAKLGDVIGMAGPRGSFILSTSFRRQVMLGDETALPEFARRMRELPANSACHAVVVIEGPEEELALPEGVEIQWLHRRSNTDMKAALTSAIAQVPAFDTQTFTWIAGEASEARHVYMLLTREMGIQKELIHSSGHWKRGVENHDHHEAIDTES